MRTPITAPATGTLVSLESQTWETTAQDATIAQMEVMKMYIEILAPAAGVVHWDKGLGDFIQEDEEIGWIE